MRIRFERTGGFAGIPMRVTIDSATLPPEEVQKLADLVDAAHFFQLPPVVPASTRGADRFHYKLTVETEDRQHTIELGEAGATAAMEPLLEWLMDAARKR